MGFERARGCGPKRSAKHFRPTALPMGSWDLREVSEDDLRRFLAESVDDESPEANRLRKTARGLLQSMGKRADESDELPASVYSQQDNDPPPVTYRKETDYLQEAKWNC